MYIYVSKKGNTIYHTYYSKTGQKKMSKHSDNLGLRLGIKEMMEDDSVWKDIYGQPLQEITFDNIKEYVDFLMEHKSTIDVYGDIAPIYQFISNNYGQGKLKFDLSFIKTFIIDIETATVQYSHRKIRIGKPDKFFDLSFDELSDHFTDKELLNQMCQKNDGTWIPYNENIFILHSGFPDLAEPEYPITSMSIKNEQTGDFYVCSTKPYNKFINTLGIESRMIQFHHAQTEIELFDWFIDLMRKEKPDILIGWYSENFDFPYIINRSYTVYDGDDKIKRISPWGEVSCEQVDSDFGTEYKTRVGGIYMLDYMKLYKKFIKKPRESYSLDFISDAHGIGRKLDYSEYDNLNDLWVKNPQKYIDYNILDVELISLLDKQIKLIDLLATLSYTGLASFYDAFGTIVLWDVLIYNRLREKNIMISPTKDRESITKESYAGAYVKEPVADVYDNLISIDAASLYPSIMIQNHISPDCLINSHIPVSLDAIDPCLLDMEVDFDEPDYILSGNGWFFDKNKQGFIPELLEEIFNKRKIFKKQKIQKEIELEKLKEEYKKLLTTEKE